MTQQEKEHFEYWLVNNIHINNARAELISRHVQHYFSPHESDQVDWDQLKKEAEKWIPKELAGDQHIKAVTIIENFFNEQREKYK